MKLRNHHVLIFGGGSGIGRAIAQKFLQNGATVTIAGRRESVLLQTKQELDSDRLFYRVFDIADIPHHAALFADCAKEMGGLTAFVNAAALGSDQVSDRGYEPWDVTEAEWDLMTKVNYKAAFFLMRNEVDYLKAHGIRGNILNIASNAACMDIVGCYGASKLSIIKWTRALGKRYGRDGIILNGIAPGATVTPMIASYAKSEDQPYPRHAIGRFLRAEEIAQLAFYLMSDYGEIICGHTVIADGGDKNATL